MAKQNFICDNCGKTFSAYPAHRKTSFKFCSCSCKAKTLRGGQFLGGEKHPLWKGGLSNKQGYLWSWKYIRPKIIKRDNECKICGSNEKLEVHHIDENKHNNNCFNLITICKKCHTKITFGFIKNPEYIFYEIELELKNKDGYPEIDRLEEINNIMITKFEKEAK